MVQPAQAPAQAAWSVREVAGAERVLDRAAVDRQVAGGPCGEELVVPGPTRRLPRRPPGGEQLVPLSLPAVCVNRRRGPHGLHRRVASCAVHARSAYGQTCRLAFAVALLLVGGLGRGLAPCADDLAIVGGGQHTERWTAGWAGEQLGWDVACAAGGEPDGVVVEVFEKVLRNVQLLHDDEPQFGVPGYD